MIDNYGLKSEIPHLSKLGCAKIIPTAKQKKSERTKIKRSWLNSRRQFSKEMGGRLAGAGFVGLILPGRPKRVYLHLPSGRI
jgi:hypothetical protein